MTDNKQMNQANEELNSILKLENVSKHFGGVTAADKVSFEVMPGEIHGLIGPNGAGKSTLMNLISGIYTPDEGNIYFDGQLMNEVPAYTRARMGMGRTFQTPRFMQRSTIYDNLVLGSDLDTQYGYFKSFFGSKNEEFREELEKLMRVAGFRLDLSEDITALSYGKLKLLEIIRSMLAKPKVMLVDEPAAGLNNREINHVMDLLRVAAKIQGIGVLLIEHSMDMIMDICENIVVINFGKVIGKGVPEEIAKNEDVIEAYLGREINA